MARSDTSCALLISTYNWPSALELVLETVLQQTRMPNQILIADDGSFDATRQLISFYRSQHQLPITHVWQEDRGFRKSLILNKAIKQCNCDYIVQIDGDILLHPSFIEDHLDFAKKGSFIQGSRVLIVPALTNELIRSGTKRFFPWSAGIKNRLNATRAPLLSGLFKEKNDSRNIKACNLAYWRSDYIKINGYNNAFTGWGWEDVEFAERLIASGVEKRRLKMAALCYHLHHAPSARPEKEDQNQVLFSQTSRQQLMWCEDGFNQAS